LVAWSSNEDCIEAGRAVIFVCALYGTRGAEV